MRGISKSQHYVEIAEGLWTKPVRVRRGSAWPLSVKYSRLLDWQDLICQYRKLVRKLEKETARTIRLSVKSYIACRGSSCRGGCLGDLLIGRSRSQRLPKPISIFKARAGEKDARLIMEVFEQSVHPYQSDNTDRPKA